MNDLILFRGCMLTRSQIDHVRQLENEKIEKDYILPPIPEELKIWKELLNRKYFWEVYKKSGYNPGRFVDIVIGTIEAERSRRKNVYVKIIENNKLF